MLAKFPEGFGKKRKHSDIEPQDDIVVVIREGKTQKRNEMRKNETKREKKRKKYLVSPANPQKHNKVNG